MSGSALVKDLWLLPASSRFEKCRFMCLLKCSIVVIFDCFDMHNFSYVSLSRFCLAFVLSGHLCLSGLM